MYHHSIDSVVHVFHHFIIDGDSSQNLFTMTKTYHSYGYMQVNLTAGRVSSIEFGARTRLPHAQRDLSTVIRTWVAAPDYITLL